MKIELKNRQGVVVYDKSFRGRESQANRSMLVHATLTEIAYKMNGLKLLDLREFALDKLLFNRALFTDCIFGQADRMVLTGCTLRNCVFSENTEVVFVDTTLDKCTYEGLTLDGYVDYSLLEGLIKEARDTETFSQGVARFLKSLFKKDL